MHFLTAEWRKLLIANYEVEPEVLQPFVPYGTELDIWRGQCFVSLVGFMFVNTRVLGIRVPFHTNFEEVNLRFYVKRDVNEAARRGVVFIKEIVPRAAITFVANTVYKENYETMRMRHDWRQEGTQQQVRYSWQKSGEWHSIAAHAGTELTDMAVGSKEEFITEHYWGYARAAAERTNEYEVKHPRWQYYSMANHEVSVDFGKTYGPGFDFLGRQAPDSVMLMEGSTISVENKNVLAPAKFA